MAYVPDEPFFIRCEDDDDCKKIKRPDWWRKKTEEEHPEIWIRNSRPIRSFAVLVPDLRHPAKPHTPTSDPPLNFPPFRGAHFPLLRFGLSDLREKTTRRVDLVCRDISKKDEEGILFLRREQIRFYLDAENASSFSFAGWAPFPVARDQLPDCCRKKPPAEPELPEWWGNIPDLGKREQLESLWWLPDLKRIVTGNTEATRVKPDVLPSYRGPFPQGLIARVECQGGRLRTFDFNRNVDGFPIPWRFAEPGNASSNGTWNRVIANALALEFFDVRSEVRIELRRLANEVITEELVLAPGPGASRPLLEISISNREPDLMFQEEGFSRSTIPDLDFQPFYELLSQARPNDWENLPIPHPVRTSFFGPTEKPCAGTQMSK